MGLISVTNGGLAAWRHGDYKKKKGSWGVGLYSQGEFKSGMLHAGRKWEQMITHCTHVVLKTIDI